MLLRTFLIALAVKILIVKGVKQQECGTMEIRLYKHLDRLTNCSVITGNLALVFPSFDLPDYSSEDINSRVFPLR